jgi:isohexenylglutaconyl-CoA hydratase
MSLFDNLETLIVQLSGFVAHVTLNRPTARNAMNFQMTRELYEVFTALQDNRAIRAIVLSGAGGTFCAGGDIKEMRENRVPAQESAGNLDDMLRAVDHAPQVVIAKVDGAALGGGLGLVCVSDIAIASRYAKFALPEVRLGIAPAFISPFVLRRLGLTRARELMLTGRRFTGEMALNYGLLHDICDPQELDQRVLAEIEEIRQAAPGAIAATKALIFHVLGRPLDETVEYRANLLNTLRRNDEGQEGLAAFQEKRAAKWTE